jgi:hypothetical protein
MRDVSLNTASTTLVSSRSGRALRPILVSTDGIGLTALEERLRFFALLPTRVVFLTARAAQH